MKQDWIYRRGDLYLAYLGKPNGSQQGGVRPVVVLQNDVGNYFSTTITVAPLTTKIKKVHQPTHFYIRTAKGLEKPSMVLGEQVMTIDKMNVIKYIGKVSQGQMKHIDQIVKAQLGYYLDEYPRRNDKRWPAQTEQK